MRILLTGHLGYVGTVLAPMLEARGHSVIGLDAGLFAGTGTRPVLANSGAEKKLDVRQMGSEYLQGTDAIIHLAALSNDPLGKLDPALTDIINHRASARLAGMARDAGVKRFIFASSCSLYGTADTDKPLDETAPLNPVSAYARSKVDAEVGIGAFANSNFSPVFLRSATVYGLSPAMRFDLVANNLVGWALTTGCIRLESDGSPWRPLVHVEDLANAYIAALEAPCDVVHNQAFNIGRDDQNFQVRDLAEIVRGTMPGCRVELVPNAGPDTRSYRVDFSKAARCLPGFCPHWGLAAGVEQMARFFRDRGLTASEFQGRNFIRLAQLRYLLETGQINAELYWTERKGKSV